MLDKGAIMHGTTFTFTSRDNATNGIHWYALESVIHLFGQMEIAPKFHSLGKPDKLLFSRTAQIILT